MLSTMSEDTTRLQIFTPKSLHKRLKVGAASIELDMGELGTALLTYGLDLIDSGKVPGSLQKLIDAAIAAKGKKDGD
jgi:hypothetical protein